MTDRRMTPARAIGWNAVVFLAYVGIGALTLMGALPEDGPLRTSSVPPCGRR